MWRNLTWATLEVAEMTLEPWGFLQGSWSLLFILCWFSGLCLWLILWFSTRGASAPQGTFFNVCRHFASLARRGGCYWHLVRRGRGCCEASWYPGEPRTDYQGAPRQRLREPSPMPSEPPKAWGAWARNGGRWNPEREGNASFVTSVFLILLPLPFFTAVLRKTIVSSFLHPSTFLEPLATLEMFLLAWSHPATAY